MIDDCNINNLAKNQVSAAFNSRAIRRKEKQRQAYTDSQCGFCGCVALSEPSIIVLLLQACLLEIYLFCKI